MKKCVLIILSVIMILCSCNAKKNEEPNIDLDITKVEKETKIPSKEDIIAQVDAIIMENLGDSVLATEYDEETETYFVMLTIEDIAIASHTSEFKELCGTLANISKTIYDGIGLNNVFVFVDDKNTDICLYATNNGDDITSILI